MITIADALKEWLITTPFVEEALARDILNLSALARELRPMLEKRLQKELTEAAVMMTLKRLRETNQPKAATLDKALAGVGGLLVRSGLGELTYRRSPSSYRCQSRLLDELKEDDEAFVTFTQGSKEMTIIISERYLPAARRAYEGEKLIKAVDRLAAISVRLDESVIFTPGIHYSLLKPLAWSGINVIEVVSTFTELTIILQADAVDRSFSLLMKILNQPR